MQIIRDGLQWLTAWLQIDSPAVQITYKAVLALVGLLVTWALLKWLLAVAKRRFARFEFFRTNEQVFDILRRLSSYALALLGGTYFIRLFGAESIAKPFYALLIVLIATPVKDFLLVAVHFAEENLATRTETQFDDILIDLLDRFVGVIVYITAIVFALDLVGVNVMPIIAGAGVAGIAIGFAAKDTLSNLIAGVLLIIDRPFEIGDRIEVWRAPSGSATWGDVIDIGLRATKIRTTDNIIIIIPNNEIMTRDIINYTLTDNMIRVRVNIGVAYDTDIGLAKQIVLDTVAQAEWILQEPPPKVVVRTFGESAVELQVRVWIGQARQRMKTISYITDNLKTAFDRMGVKIPYPRRDIQMVSTPQKPIGAADSHRQGDPHANK